MAEAIGLAASILSIAGAGISVTSTLYSFAKSYSSVDAKVEGIAGSVSITAAILMNLGDIVKQNPQDFKKDESEKRFKDATAACKKDFDCLKEALGRVKKEWKNETGGRMEKMTTITPWDKLKWAIGGEKIIHDLMESLRESKSNLQLLLTSLNYGLLIKSKRENVLTPQMADQLADLTKEIRWIAQNLRQAAFAPDAVNGKNIMSSSKTPPGVQQVGSHDSYRSPSGLPDPREKGNNSGDIKSTESVAVPRPSFVANSPQNLPKSSLPAPPPLSSPDLTQGIERSASLGSSEAEENAPDSMTSPSYNTRSRGFRSRPSIQPPHYEAYSFVFSKVWIVKRLLFKVTMTSLRTPVNNCHIYQIRATQVELVKAANDGRSTSVLEILTSLPNFAQKAIVRHVDTRERPNPCIAAVKVMKRPFLSLLMGLLNKSLAVLIVLEYEDKGEVHALEGDLAHRKTPRQWGMRALENFPRGAGEMAEMSPIRQVAMRSSGPPRRRVDAEAKTRQSSSPWKFTFLPSRRLTDSPNDNKLPEDNEAAEEKIEDAQEEPEAEEGELYLREASDFADDGLYDADEDLYGRSSPAYSQVERLQPQLFDQAGDPETWHTHTAAASSSLPSEQEAEEMMEKFLAGFTTLYDDDKGGKAALEH